MVESDDLANVLSKTIRLFVQCSNWMAFYDLDS